MKIYLGIDLGSTTSKSVLIDEQGKIIGRGITNTRSNYTVAADIARTEAEFNARFTWLDRNLTDGARDHQWDRTLTALEGRFHYLQFKKRFDRLEEAMSHHLSPALSAQKRADVSAALKTATATVDDAVRPRYLNGDASSTAEFFRDIFGSAYLHAIDQADPDLYDELIAVYDRSITPVENQAIEFDFVELVEQSIELLPADMTDRRSQINGQLKAVAQLSLEPTDYIGTGYGRQLLPFEEKHIKSEILCHAIGAHAYFPQTRTVLDIGGQDTKAIQVDSQGFVTSFQMNDRCAAGCGRYLGYIADEMNIGVSELGPMTMKAEYEANICSTCTVFAGAELREYLNLGEKKENVLAGLHKAIVQRAFSLLARSGGVRDQFTFTGGVARNEAVVKYVGQLVESNYGQIKINIHPDSIFMGALGAALFSSMR